MSEEKLDLPEQTFGPGKLLRAKREEYEWSVDAVAEALHLSTHAVKAIEADRYDDLPGATYVLGYWRSYARLLGIDINDAIEANKSNLNILTAEAAGLDVNRVSRRRKGLGGLMILVLLGILGGLGYYAWQNQFFGMLDKYLPELTSGTDQPSQPATAPTVDAPDDGQAERNQVLRPLPGQAADEKLPEQETSSPSDVSEPTLMPASSDAGLVPVTEPDSGSQSQSLTESAPQSGLQLAPQAEASANDGAVQAEQPAQETTDSAAPAPEAEEKSAPATTATNDASTLVVTLTTDSWLDIRDGSSKRLVYKNETAGKELTVKGTPPFYIYIGSPEGVTIQYQGKKVPFEKHESGLFARFKLGDGILEKL